MTGAELDQSGGRDGAFEMQMQLGLGQAADEVLNFRHSLILAAPAVRQPPLARH